MLDGDPYPSRPTCTRCLLHTHAIRSVGVPTVRLGLSVAPTTPALLFLGMNPGYYEDMHNEPFYPVERLPTTGQPNSGWVLRNLYIKPLDLEELATIYISNVVRCGPAPNPPAAAVIACYPYLASELDHLASSHCESRLGVVLLGEFAAKQFFRRTLGITGLSTVGDCRSFNGEVHEHNGYKLTTFTTFHPAGFLRKRALIASIDEHMEMVYDFITDTMVHPQPPTLIPSRSPRT